MWSTRSLWEPGLWRIFLVSTYECKYFNLLCVGFSWRENGAGPPCISFCDDNLNATADLPSRWLQMWWQIIDAMYSCLRKTNPDPVFSMPFFNGNKLNGLSTGSQMWSTRRWWDSGLWRIILVDSLSVIQAVAWGTLWLQHSSGTQEGSQAGKYSWSGWLFP